MSALSSQYRSSVLSSGMKLITLKMPARRAVQVGIIIRVGSRDAPDSGLPHFLEHMLFKGTDKRNAFNIFYEIEKVGGWLNGHTSQESTSFYSMVPADQMETAVDILLDLISSPTFPEDQIKKEKGVVLEEIGHIENSSSARAWEKFPKILWDGHPLSNSIIGTRQEVKEFTRQDILNFYKANYTAPNTFFVGVGAVEHQQLKEMIEKRSDKLNRNPVNLNRTPPPSHSPQSVHEFMDTTQLHIVTGRPVFSFADKRRYPFELLNSILASERDSSRLFQLLREEHGLVYGVYGLTKYFTDAGFYGINLATSPNLLEQTLDILKEELKRLPGSLTQDELDATKLYIRGQTMIESEELTVLFWRLTGLEKLLGTYFSLEEELEKIEQVKLSELKQIAEQFLNPDHFSSVIVGKRSEK